MIEWVNHKEEIEKAHNLVYNQKALFDSQHELYICHSDETDKQFLQSIQKFKLPSISKLSINSVSVTCESDVHALKNFLRNSHQQISQIEIGSEDSNTRFEDIKDAVVQILPKAKEFIAIV
mmetsp:Transcript_36774/g.42290  ORF Transcript_36774/g.42290 Transcript_36774/m.42290 type:complete len:121 (+) Transcript_36774:164-526(+)